MSPTSEPLVKALWLPNHYESDAEEEISCAGPLSRVGCGICGDAYAQGARGAAALASAVVEVIESKPSRPLVLTYSDDDPIEQKT